MPHKNNEQNFSFPQGFILGNPSDTGHSFFDSCAQALAVILRKVTTITSYSSEGLQKVCIDFINDLDSLTTKKNNWIYQKIVADLRKNKVADDADINKIAEQIYRNLSSLIQDGAQCGIATAKLNGFSIDRLEQEIYGMIICSKFSKHLTNTGLKKTIKIHLTYTDNTTPIDNATSENYIIDEEDITKSNDTLETLYSDNDANVMQIRLAYINSRWHPVLLAADLVNNNNIAGTGQSAEQSARLNSAQLLYTMLDKLDFIDQTTMDLFRHQIIDILNSQPNHFQNYSNCKEKLNSYSTVYANLMTQLKQQMDSINAQSASPDGMGLYITANQGQIDDINNNISKLARFNAAIEQSISTFTNEFLTLINNKTELELEEDLFDKNAQLIHDKKELNNIYRKIALALHPDKHKFEHRVLANELTAKLNVIYAKLSVDFEKSYDSSAVDFYVRLAQKFYEQALDCQNCVKEATIKLKHFDRSILKNLTPSELLRQKHTYAKQAYVQYRKVAAMVDKELNNILSDTAQRPSLDLLKTLIIKQIELRNLMSLCLHISGASTEAQLCAFVALKLFLKHKNRLGSIAQKIVIDGERTYKFSVAIINKIKDSLTHDITKVTPATAEAVSHNEQSNALVLHSIAARVARQEDSNNEIDIDDGITELLLRQVTKADPRLVAYTSSKKNIMQAKQDSSRLTWFGRVGILTGLGFTGVGVTSIGGAVLSVGIRAAIAGTTPLGAALTIGQLVAGGTSLYCGYNSTSAGATKMKEPIIRENLNKNIEQALGKYYNEQNSVEFLRLLSQPYNVDREEKRLFTFIPGKSIKISPEFIINELLQHNFRPDGIAFILTAIGEVLLSKKVELHDEFQNVINAHAFLLFKGLIESKLLTDKAKELDEMVHKNMVKRNADSFLWFWNSGTSYDIPNEYYADRAEQPFFSRLEEVRNIARINLALLCFNEPKKAAGYLQQIQKSANISLACYDIIKERSEIVVDYLSLLGEQVESTDDNNEWLAITAPISILPTVSHCNTKAMWSYDALRPEPLANSSVDALTVLNNLTQPSLVIEHNDILTKLANLRNNHDFNEIADELLHKFNNSKLAAAEAFSYKYLKLIASLTNINFYVCTQNYAENRYEVIETIFTTTTPRSAVYVVFAEPSLAAEPILAFAASQETILDRLLKEKQDATNAVRSSELAGAIAQHYYDQAKAISKNNYLNSIDAINNAIKYFQEALISRSDDEGYCLQLAGCLIHKHQFKEAREFLETKQAIFQTSLNKDKYELLLAKLFRKLKQYDAALSHTHNVNSRSTSTHLAQKEIKICGKLKEFKTNDEYIAHLKQMQIIDREEPATTNVGQTASDYTRNSEQQSTLYNILSIDGGGIRGIIPAIWLAEIERRTYRPISDSFQLMAGTSTGGILALGLNTVNKQTTKPYRAHDLLDLYTTKAGSIFTKQFNVIGKYGILTPKYSNDGRERLFKEYFGDTELKQARTEVVVPTVDISNLNLTYYFDRHAAITNPEKNYKLSDVAMATSSAPTFFPAFKYNSNRTFIDGGVTENNPVQAALTYALSYGVAENRINMLSLGTGDCLHKLSLSSGESGLFWAANLCNITLDPATGNSEHGLHTRLKDRYQRWQSWFEDVIPLDSYDQTTIATLIDSAREVIEEMDAADENVINNLVKKLDRQPLRQP